jgi:hypothetical protein
LGASLGGNPAPAAPNVAPAIGTDIATLGSPFPATPGALSTLTGSNINFLSIVYNDDFGIAQGDVVAQKLNKFEHWLCH